MSSKMSYNARHVPPKDVANSFVVPEDFHSFAEFSNSLLIGPRGAGKTTLLKALTPSGLYHLNNRSEIKEKLMGLQIDYIPVYIPAESSWKGDATTIRDEVADKALQDHILNGLFVDHTLRWLVLALEDSSKCAEKYGETERPEWAILIDQDCEEYISRKLSILWQLERVQTSFLGLKLALVARSNTFRSAINSIGSQFSTENVINIPRLDILEMFKGVIEVFQSKFGVKKWCFNFDEMEIAPRSVLVMLYENLRSWDQRAVLKFSLFPYAGFYSIEEKLAASETGPIDGQDYKSFMLSGYFSKSEKGFAKKVSFSKELVEAECDKRGISIFEFADYLNSSKAMVTREFSGLEFERNYTAIFERSFSVNPDKGFKAWMKKNSFDSVNELVAQKGENRRARTIRKIAPVVEFRGYYLSHVRSETTRNSGRSSSKGHSYYHGYNQIVDLTEGNPRAIKFYVNELLDAMQSGEQPSFAQNRVISRNVDRFRALIASQVVPLVGQSSNLENSLAFVDKIGEIFVKEILSVDMKSQPRLSAFLEQVDPQTEKIVEVAINSGALIVDHSDSGNRLVFNSSGERLRLSHRFAPYQPLPTITGGPMHLNISKLQEVKIPDSHPDLFSWEGQDG